MSALADGGLRLTRGISLSDFVAQDQFRAPSASRTTLDFVGSALADILTSRSPRPVRFCSIFRASFPAMFSSDVSLLLRSIF